MPEKAANGIYLFGTHLQGNQADGAHKMFEIVHLIARVQQLMIYVLGQQKARLSRMKKNKIHVNYYS